jgi:surface antigen/LysM repeat protein
MKIRTQIATSNALQNADIRQRIASHHSKTRKKNEGPSAGKIAAYVGAFLLFVSVVAVGYESPKQVSSQVSNSPQANANSVNAGSVIDTDEPSVDQVVATGVAADLAERANLPVASNVANMSVSLSAKSELAQNDTTAITKPQIITPGSSTNEIRTHIVKKGETVPEVASLYGLSADTIRWANGLSDTDALEPGRKLSILPDNGLLYTVKAGDTVQSIANQFSSSATRITLVNNLELSGVKAGQRIIVPGGEKPEPVAPVNSSPAGQSFGSSLGGSVISSGMLGVSAGNRYAPGNCTWYVYERRAQLGRPIGSFWGNANTWASSARAAGFRVDNAPASGSILVDQAGYFGHVGVVERVKPNGDIVITEMNNYAYGGFNIVNERTISAGQARAYQYIH